MQSNPFLGKTERWAFLLVPSTLNPMGINIVRAYTTIRNCFFDAHHISDKGLVSKIYKEHIQLNYKKKTNQSHLKNGQGK